MVAATQQKSNKKKKQKRYSKHNEQLQHYTRYPYTHFWQHSCSIVVISSHIIFTVFLQYVKCAPKNTPFHFRGGSYHQTIWQISAKFFA